MEAILFIGLQASGKSTFFRKRFFDTHVRINLDMLRTRHREQLLLKACLAAKQPFVVDNTNPAREVRSAYIAAAREAGFRVHGYYFESRIADCLQRNALREGAKRIPDAGVKGTHARLQLPELSEGFDALFYVRLNGEGFSVEEWKDEVR